MAAGRPELTPGAWIGVRFADDPGYVHERILEWPIGPVTDRSWIVVTSDGHEYAERVADWPSWFWLAGRCDGGYPVDVGDDEVIAFADPVGDAGMLKLIRRGRALAPATCTEMKVAAAVAPKVWTSWEGVEHELPAASIGDRLRTRMVPGAVPQRRVMFKSKGTLPAKMVIETPILEAGADGPVWMITDSSDAMRKFGEVVTPSIGSVVVGPRGLFKHDETTYLNMELVNRADCKGLVKRFIARLGHADPAAKDAVVDLRRLEKEDLRARLGGVDGPKPVEPAAVKADAVDEDDDSRTLWVDVDAHGLRRKSFEKCILESYAVPYGDSSRIRGPPTTLHTMNYFFENGGDPRLWLEVFRGSKGISRTDRVWHELSTLVEVFWHGAMVDQLNLPGLVCFEVLSRRLLAMIEAYADPNRVNWAASKFYTGAAGLDDAAPTEMRTFVSKAARELQDLEATRQRGQTLAGRASGATDDGGDGDDDGAAAGKGSGKKRGGGRGGGKFRTPPGPKA